MRNLKIIAASILAIISGLATRSRARRIILWVENECDILRAHGELPPNFFPYITEQDPDWHSRYEIYIQAFKNSRTQEFKNSRRTKSLAPRSASQRSCILEYSSS